MKKFILIFVLCFNISYADFLTFTNVKDNVAISINFLSGRFLKDSFMIPVTIVNNSKKPFRITKQDICTVNIFNKTYDFKLYEFQGFYILQPGKTRTFEFKISFKDYPEQIIDFQFKALQAMNESLKFKNNKERIDSEKELNKTLSAVYHPFENDSINLFVKFLEKK
jgi:hypothetical protein